MLTWHDQYPRSNIRFSGCKSLPGMLSLKDHCPPFTHILAVVSKRRDFAAHYSSKVTNYL